MARIEQYGHLRDFQICEYAGAPLDLCDECADAFQKFIDERTGWKVCDLEEVHKNAN